MRGWHLTGTCGTFAAAATASVLLGLDAATTASALGLAGTQSAGLWAFTSDGSMSKRIHPGKAAQDGADGRTAGAARLRRAALHSGSGRRRLPVRDVGCAAARAYHRRPGQHLAQRRHLLQALFLLRQQPRLRRRRAREPVSAHGLAVSDVDRVIAGIPRVVQTQTGFDYEADSVLNAQMSLRYNIAVAMLRRPGLPGAVHARSHRRAEGGGAGAQGGDRDPRRRRPRLPGSLWRPRGPGAQGRHRLSRHVEYSRGMPRTPCRTPRWSASSCR